MTHNVGLLHGPTWQRVRKAALERSGWKCEQCGGYGSHNDRLECHHVVELHLGGAPYALENIRVLHRSEHIAHHALGKKKPLSEAALRWKVLVDELR